jgi:GNAT superfamily N-acetyltransferase
MKRLSEQFTLRPGTLEDVPQIVPMANRWAQETLGRNEFTLDSFAEEWRDPTLDLATNTRVAELPGGTIAGCVEVWSSAPFVSHWLWACVDPALRGSGIGTAMMEWAEARARETIGLAPAGARVTTIAASIGMHQPTTDLLRDRGFEAIRSALTMERALDAGMPAPAWPAGIEVYPMRPGQERAVYRAVDESFQDHWGHLHVPEDEGFPIWLHRMADRPAFDPSLWFVAVEADEIAGVALCFPERGGDQALGWVSTLGVRRPWRKRGLGLALLYHAFGELRRRGCARVGLGVDGQSLTGATRLYEKAGMRAVTRSITFEKELRPGHDLATRTVS